MAYQNYIASRIISSEKFSSSGSSTKSGEAPFGCTIVRIGSSAAVNIVIGPSPTATASGTLIPAGESSYFVIKGQPNPEVDAGGEQVASIGTATVNCTWLEG